MPLYLRSDDDPLLKAIQDSTAVKKGDDYHYLPQRARNEHRNYNILQSKEELHFPNCPFV